VPLNTGFLGEAVKETNSDGKELLFVCLQDTMDPIINRYRKILIISINVR